MENPFLNAPLIGNVHIKLNLLCTRGGEGLFTRTAKKPPTQQLRTTKFDFSTNQKSRYRLKALTGQVGTGTTLLDPEMPQASPWYHPVKTQSGFWSKVLCEFANAFDCVIYVKVSAILGKLH